jgi:glycosyltransferase involved in cell wall biosynthesis
LSNVDVIISVYSIDRAKDVAACIASVKAQSLPPKEIIVVLDPNADLINYYRSRLDTGIKLLISPAFGLCSARNMGIANSASELVAFIDDDAVADPDWLKNLVQNFEDLSVVGVGGRIIPVWPKKNPEWFPEELYWIVGCSYKGLPNIKAPIRNPIGCNMAFRRSTFEAIGCFSIDVGRVGNKLLGHDDTDFGIRIARKLPYVQILFEPNAIVYHQVSPNRVNLKYVIKRSYAEGFSKAFVARNNLVSKSILGSETTYLHTLLRSMPSLIFSTKVSSRIPKLATLLLSTMLVFIGYIVGLRSAKL